MHGSNFGTVANKWIIRLSVCRTTFQILNMWRNAKFAGILKPGNDPEMPENYRPISLLCFTYVSCMKDSFCTAYPSKLVSDLYQPNSERI